MELMASDSSALLVLSMQQVSIQIYAKLSFLACVQLYMKFMKPFLWDEMLLSMSCRVTSSSPHICERVAYRGIALPNNSSIFRVEVLRSRMQFNKHQGPS